MGVAVHQHAHVNQGFAQGTGAVHHFVFKFIVRKFDEVEPARQAFNFVTEKPHALFQPKQAQSPVAAKLAGHEHGDGSTQKVQPWKLRRICQQVPGKQQLKRCNSPIPYAIAQGYQPRSQPRPGKPVVDKERVDRVTYQRQIDKEQRPKNGFGNPAHQARMMTYPPLQRSSVKVCDQAKNGPENNKRAQQMATAMRGAVLRHFTQAIEHVSNGFSSLCVKVVF